MSDYELVDHLSCTIDRSELVRHEQPTSAGWTRVSTEVRLYGEDCVGFGEDVTYEATHHETFQESGLPPIEGDSELRSISDIVGDIDLFPNDPPEREVFRNYRRWGVESAALDLALKQADRTLAEAVDRSYEPVSFVVSTRLGDPPTIDRVHEWLEIDPDLRFKLDPTTDWSDELIEDLAATEAVEILDLKGLYEDIEVEQPPDPELYETLFELFPEATIEDPAVTEETEPILEDEWDRISWDVPIHGVSDLDDRPVEPTVINFKPSRIGSLESVFDVLEACRERDIALYGGGQYELSVGRAHLHALASLYYPDATNDIAPAPYNEPEPRSGLPKSPLAPPATSQGLEW
jgi:hypothetical protein